MVHTYVCKYVYIYICMYIGAHHGITASQGLRVFSGYDPRQPLFGPELNYNRVGALRTLSLELKIAKRITAAQWGAAP